MTTTTDFLSSEAPVGRGAGGNGPRRLIPSRFQGTSAVGEGTPRTDSLIGIVVVLAVSLAASLGASLVLHRSAERSVVIAPVHLPADSAAVHDSTDLLHPPSEPTELFE